MPVTASHRIARALAAIGVAASLAAGCGDDDGATTTTSQPRSEEAATAAWVEENGSAGYLGPCPLDFDPQFPLEGVCSVELSADGGRSVLGLGPPFSEITAYLLLEEDEDGWGVVDTYTPASPYDLSDAPSWLPADPTAGA